MFAAIKNNKTIVTGQSKSQVRRILTQKGLNFDKYKIIEVEDDKHCVCPICKGEFKLDKKNMHIIPKKCSCFFCSGGIKI